MNNNRGKVKTLARSVFAAVALLFSITLFCSCDMETNSPFVGTWRYSNLEYTFYSNGSLDFVEYHDDSYGNQYYGGTWTYDDDTRLLVISTYPVRGTTGYGKTVTYYVQSISSTRMVLIYRDGEAYGSFEKQ